MLRTLDEAAFRASGAYSVAEKCLRNKKTCLKSELREYVLNYCCCCCPRVLADSKVYCCCCCCCCCCPRVL